MEQTDYSKEILKKVIIEQMTDFNSEVITLLTMEDVSISDLLVIADIYDVSIYNISYLTSNYPNSIEDYVEYINREEYNEIEED